MRNVISGRFRVSVIAGGGLCRRMFEKGKGWRIHQTRFLPIALRGAGVSGNRRSRRASDQVRHPEFGMPVLLKQAEGETEHVCSPSKAVERGGSPPRSRLHI